MSLSLKRNILASYVSQFYVTLSGIAMVPFYIRYMGVEAYGLVGFYAMLQAWFQLLDLGLTPTIARETARFHGGAVDSLSYLRLVRALEGVFFTLALLGGGIMLSSAGYIAQSWLQTTNLPVSEVETAVQLIAAIVTMRWMCGLYRGVITGTERLVWLGGYNSLIATFRFLFVLLVLIFVGATPTIFFCYQFVIAMLEMAGLLFYTYRLLPNLPKGGRLKWSYEPIKPVLKFSLTIAFTSSLWILLTQTDKLMLSKLLNLVEYGYFTLAVLVASGIMVISAPIGTSIMPRMAKLQVESHYAHLLHIYRSSTQLVAVTAGAASITLAFFAEPLLWAWTGDKLIASHTAPIVKLYALGNGILALSAFPFYLQYAKGDLKMHLIGSTGFIVLLVPTIIWAANRHGGIGAGYVWLLMNIIVFFGWLPFVHHKFAPGLNFKWYIQDVLVIVLFAATTAYCFSGIMPDNVSRWSQAGMILGIGLLVMIAGACASTVVWVKVKTGIEQWKTKR
jgi:O-antigen/teichoic acid export membrane protein